MTKETLSVVIGTRNRENCLVGCLSSIINQTYLPDEIVIFNDGDHEFSSYTAKLLTYIDKELKIKVYLNKGLGGNAKNFQQHLLGCQCDIIFRIDDDCILDERCYIKNAINELKHGCLVSSHIIDPTAPLPTSKLDKNTLSNLQTNVQWQAPDKIIEGNEHLYSSFLFYKNDVIGRWIYYPACLSNVSHREETIFSYQCFRKGFNLKVLPQVMWHLRCQTGGIREFPTQYYDHDEQVFKKWLEVYNKIGPDRKIVLSNSAVGDRICLSTQLKKINELYPDIVFALAPDDIFTPEYTKGLEKISMEDAMLYYLGTMPVWSNIYHWMADRKWKGQLKDAYFEMYSELFKRRTV